MIIYTLKVENKRLSNTLTEPLYQYDNLSESLHILVPQTVEGIEVSKIKLVLEYVLPVSKIQHNLILKLKSSDYKGYLEYIIEDSTGITSEVGEVKLCLWVSTIKIVGGKLNINPSIFQTQEGKASVSQSVSTESDVSTISSVMAVSAPVIHSAIALSEPAATYDTASSNINANNTDYVLLDDGRYRVYNEYYDFDYAIIAYDREIVFQSNQINISQESNSQYISFRMDRFYNGIDRLDKKIEIHYTIPNGDEDSDTPVNVQYNGNFIIFAWLISPKVTQLPGNITFEIIVVGENEKKEFYTWKTKQNKELYVIQSLSGNGISEPNPDWLTNYIRIQNEQSKKFNSTIAEINALNTETKNLNTKTVAATQAAVDAAGSIQVAVDAAAAAKTDRIAAEAAKDRVELLKDNFDGYGKLHTDRTYANAIIGTASGTGSVSISDAWTAPVVNLAIEGGSEQLTTKGVQLFDTSNLESSNGTTFAISPDTRSIAVYSTTAYGYAQIRVDSWIGKTIYMSIESLEGTQKLAAASQGYVARVRYTLDGTSYTNMTLTRDKLSAVITIPTEAISVRVQFMPNNSAEVLNSYGYYTGFMASEVPDAIWEPYSGGKASPNPDYPQEIKDVSPVVVSSIAPRNLLLNTDFVSTDAWNFNNMGTTSLPYWSVVDGTATCDRTSLDVSITGYSSVTQFVPYGDSLVLNAPYTISFDINIEVAGNELPFRWYLPNITGTSGDNNWTPVTGTTSGWVAVSKTITFTAKKDNNTPTMYFRCFNGSKVSVRNIKFEQSSVATPWTPAPEDITEDNKAEYLPYISVADLQGISLHGINNVRDMLQYRNGVWGIERHMQQIIVPYDDVKISRMETSISGKYRWIFTSENFAYLATDVSSGKKVGIYCSHTKEIVSGETWNNKEGITCSLSTSAATRGALFVYIDAWSELNVDELQVVLEENPLTITYPIATPTWEPLPDNLQTQLNQLTVYAGDTACVYVVGSDVVPGLAVEYVKDTNKVIGELTAAIVALGGVI